MRKEKYIKGIGIAATIVAIGLGYVNRVDNRQYEGSVVEKIIEEYTNLEGLLEQRSENLENKIDKNIVSDIIFERIDKEHILHKTERYSELIKKISETYNVSPSLIQSMIYYESKGNPLAVSKGGAKGLMQVMPGTFRAFNKSKGKIIEPEQSIDVGARYFSTLLENYNQNYVLALLAYNIGPKRLNRFLSRNKLNKKVDWGSIKYKLSRSRKNYVLGIIGGAIFLEEEMKDKKIY